MFGPDRCRHWSILLGPTLLVSVAHAQTRPATTSRPARTIAQAQQLLKAKDLEEARTVLESLISHEPASAQAQLAKAQRPAPYLSIPSTPARPTR